MLGRMVLGRGRAGKVPQVAVPTLEPRALTVLLAVVKATSLEEGPEAGSPGKSVRRGGCLSVWGREGNQLKSPSADLGIGDAMARDDRGKRCRVPSCFQGSSPLSHPSPSLHSPRIREGSEA